MARISKITKRISVRLYSSRGTRIANTKAASKRAI